MRAMTTGVAAAAGLAALTQGSAMAAPEVAPWASLTVVVGAFDQDGLVDPQPVARAALGADATWLLDNGVSVGASLAGAAEADNRRRGALGGCTPTALGCPALNGRAIASPLSRLTTDPAARARDGRARLEAAYLFARGGWGEASVGADTGVGARFSLAPPSVLRGATLTDPSIDPTGLGGVLIAADLTGSSPKASYTSPRWLGVKAGASYTPNVDSDDLRGPVVRTPGAQVFDGRDAWEVGLSFDRTWAGGVQTTFGAARVEADDARAGGYGTVRLSSYGAQVGRGAVKAGLAYSEGEASALPGREMRSLAGGVTLTRGDWAFEAGAGRMRDQLVGATVRSGQVAAARQFSDRVSLSAALTYAERTAPASVLSNELRSTGVKLGFSLDL